MKRSEMVEIIRKELFIDSPYSGAVSAKHVTGYKSQKHIADMLLRKLEKEGMLPPAARVVEISNEWGCEEYFDYFWESEKDVDE